MNIPEIYKLREDTERTIAEALQEFQEKTALEVTAVYLITEGTDESLLPFIMDVALRVELP